MSYLSHLVQRTLGLTPVAQPVIQAKFAPKSPLITAPGQDAGSIQIVSQAFARPDVSPSSEPGTGLLRIPSPLAIATGEATGTREGRDAPNARSLRPIESEESPRNPREAQDVRVVSRRPDTSRLTAPAEQSSPIEQEITATSAVSRNPIYSDDGFRLMPGIPLASAVPEFSHVQQAEAGERPIVRVHIGRVDVRMVPSVSKEVRTTTQASGHAKPASLDEYLRAKQRGAR